MTIASESRGSAGGGPLRGSISNSEQIFLPDKPGADVLSPDFVVTEQTLRMYGFEQEAPFRYVLDLLAKGKL